MKIIFILILTIIKFSLSCDDLKKISLLPDINNIKSSVGEDIILVCCHPDGAGNLIWENNENKEMSFNTYNGTFIIKDEKNRLILRIDNIDKSREGTYTCKHKKRELSKVVLIILKSQTRTPRIIKDEKYFPKNGLVKLECPINERQTFKSWIFSEGGKNILKNKDEKGDNYEISNDRLVFTVVNREKSESIKAAWCKCQEIDQNGDLFELLYEFTWSFYEPIDVRVVLENKEPIIEGHDVTLTCYFNPYQPQAAQFPTRIIKSNFIINEPEAGKIVLVVKKITKDLDGVYECKVNKFLSKIIYETANIKINVIVPPKIIRNDMMDLTAKIQEDVYMKCIISSSQLEEKDAIFERFISHNSSWIKVTDNEERYVTKITRQKDQVTFELLIRKVLWDDRGKYRCLASNAAGKDSMEGVLKVEKSPELYTETKTIFMAMKPVRIDCSVSGFPISNSEDTVNLRVVNETSPISIKYLERKYQDMEGLRVFFEVAYQSKVNEGNTYLLECFYHNSRTKHNKVELITLKIGSRPDIPNVSILCVGSSGVVFRYEKPVVTDTNKEVGRNVIQYAPSKKFELLKHKPSRVIPIDGEDKTKKHFVYVLNNLMPSTNYTFKWESYNSFQMSNMMILNAKTANLSRPNPPKSLEFSTKNNQISVTVSWDDICPHQGVNSAIRDIIVDIKPLNANEKTISNWKWVETNFTIEIEKSSLQFLVSIEKPQVNYEIEVSLRSAQGISDSIKSTYNADIVLAGSLFSCFPRCSSQSFSSSFIVFQSGLIAFIILFVIQTHYVV